MKRLVLTLALGTALALLGLVPASAQTYEAVAAVAARPRPPRRRRDAQSGGDSPCQPRTTATASDPVVTPGQTITVTTPPAFAPGSAVTVNWVHVDESSTASTLKETTANSSGAADTGVTIPNVPPGVYFLYLTGVDADGNTTVALVPIVVRGSSAATGEQAAAQPAAAQTAGAGPVPAQVAEVQQDLSPKVEASVVEAVSAGDAGLVLTPDRQLSVRTPQGTQSVQSLATTGRDLTTPITVGSALVLAGTGLVLLRRRKVALR